MPCFFSAANWEVFVNGLLEVAVSVVVSTQSLNLQVKSDGDEDDEKVGRSLLRSWWILVEKVNAEVKLQRNALSVIELPTGIKDDADNECENTSSNNSLDLASNDFQKIYKPKLRPRMLGASTSRNHATQLQSIGLNFCSHGMLKVDFSKLETSMSWRYWRHFNLVEGTKRLKTIWWPLAALKKTLMSHAGKPVASSMSSSGNGKGKGKNQKGSFKNSKSSWWRSPREILEIEEFGIDHVVSRLINFSSRKTDGEHVGNDIEETLESVVNGHQENDSLFDDANSWLSVDIGEFGKKNLGHDGNRGVGMCMGCTEIDGLEEFPLLVEEFEYNEMSKRN
eukprot:Gb_31150 [translate_table: standard]